MKRDERWRTWAPRQAHLSRKFASRDAIAMSARDCCVRASWCCPAPCSPSPSPRSAKFPVRTGQSRAKSRTYVLVVTMWGSFGPYPASQHGTCYESCTYATTRGPSTVRTGPDRQVRAQIGKVRAGPVKGVPGVPEVLCTAVQVLRPGSRRTGPPGSSVP